MEGKTGSNKDHKHNKTLTGGISKSKRRPKKTKRRNIKKRKTSKRRRKSRRFKKKYRPYDISIILQLYTVIK